MQRSNVLLPEPLAPIMLTTIPRSTSKDTPRRTSSGPNLLCTSTTRIVGLSRFVFMGSLGARGMDNASPGCLWYRPSVALQWGARVQSTPPAEVGMALEDVDTPALLLDLDA